MPWDMGPSRQPRPRSAPAVVSEADAPRGHTAVRCGSISRVGEPHVVWEDGQDWAEAWRAGFER